MVNPSAPWPLPRVAVLVPCLNEAATIAEVVADFRAALPAAAVVVIDNGSTDGTPELAAAAGARVLVERERGKGAALRAGLRDCDAECYLLIDGDGQMDPALAEALLKPLVTGSADMVVGSRMLAAGSEFRLVNRLGNHAYAWLVRLLLRARLTDVLSGYRAISRKLVDETPLTSQGFEVEVELTVKTLAQGFRIVETPAVSRPRARATASKIRIAHDGARILWTIIRLYLDTRRSRRSVRRSTVG